jgi:hypothetical protein
MKSTLTHIKSLSFLITFNCAMVILLVVGMGGDAQAQQRAKKPNPQQSGSQSFFVLQFCSGGGQSCNNDYSTTVQLDQGKQVTMEFAVLSSHCSSIILTITALGRSVTKTLGYASNSASGPTSTGPLDFGIVPATGPYTITLHADGVQGGCNAGTLFSWGGTLTITACSPTPQAGTLTANPSSGAPGTSVTVTGTGWQTGAGSNLAYRLLFDINGDGTFASTEQVAQQGPLTCDQQPSMSFDVPCLPNFEKKSATS